MHAGPVPKDAIARLEQRLHRRFPIILDVQYELLNGNPITRFGSGRTVNISSGGVFFETEGDLPIGGPIELIMDWPLKDVQNLKMIMQGNIIRRDATGTAVKVTRRQLRTSEPPTV
jgi:hypothetical protein